MGIFPDPQRQLTPHSAVLGPIWPNFQLVRDVIDVLFTCKNEEDPINQSRTNGPINAHLTIAQVMPKYNHNNEKQEALL